MMENFDKIVTKDITKQIALKIGLRAEKDKGILPEIKGITVGLSTGTSGNRGIFLASSIERAKWAGIVLAKLLPRSIFYKQSIALFLRSNSKLYETLNSNKLSFSYYSLLDSWHTSLLRINKDNPNVIVAPPSVLKKLAQAQEDKTINLLPLRIISAAEVLIEEDKKIIENAFEQKLHQIYQCTEGFLAATCEYGTLHLNEEFIKFEKKWLDKEKTRFSPIITDTLRTTQPIIRYELNDILIIDKSSCACGSNQTRLKSIVGRCDDIFKFENIEIYPDYIRQSITQASHNIEEYCVIQNSIKLVTLSIKSPTSKEIALAKESLIELFKAFKVDNFQIEIKEYSTPPPDQKFRRVISYVK